MFMGRIFVVDDDPSSLQIFKVLTKHGLDPMRLKTFASPTLALKYFLSNPLVQGDVLVTDYEMPELNGFEMLLHLHQHYMTKGYSFFPFQVIAISSHPEFNSIIKHYKNLNITAFFIKPLSNVALHSIKNLAS
jgi:response regulator RpfG family c-di-GMP phosphodiesterase